MTSPESTRMFPPASEGCDDLPFPLERIIDESRDSISGTGQIRQFAEGLEMLNPQLYKTFTVTDPRGRKQSAFEIYEGRLVRRFPNGEPFIFNNISYLVVGSSPEFQEGGPHLQPFETSSEAWLWCDAAISGKNCVHIED